MWQPTADATVLRARARLLADIRDFFSTRNVLEVETPLLCQAGVTDPNQQQIEAGGRFLQTSPEYAMKRLLAAGSGPIYQICKAFRGAESGARHNPEFTLLEWYRPGYDQRALMQEVGFLVNKVLGREGSSSVSYRELFQRELALDPFTAATPELSQLARSHIELDFSEASRDVWLDLLMSGVIEPRLVNRGLVFVYDYPPSQAALARLVRRGETVVAERFELYVDGMELANGYSELTDAAEQARRFAADNNLRELRGQARLPIDQRLLQALEQGLPECAGVALGLDRLLMLQQGSESIEQMLSFAWESA